MLYDLQECKLDVNSLKWLFTPFTAHTLPAQFTISVQLNQIQPSFNIQNITVFRLTNSILYQNAIQPDSNNTF